MRINPALKADAENILSKIGIPMSTAVDMFLNRVVLVGGILFSVILPMPPMDIDSSRMTENHISYKI